MSTSAETLRNAVEIKARGVVNRVAEFSIRVWRSSEFEPIPPTEAITDNAFAARARQTALYENHPLASISGLLNDHPLRDEYLEVLRMTE